MKTVKVIHNRQKCIGCRSCLTIAPQNWQMDEVDGKANLLGAQEKGAGTNKTHVGEIFECDIPANQKAAAACPRNIIKVGN
jgi:ferredoxin